MNPRSLVMATCIALAMTYALFQISSKFTIGGSAPSETDQISFAGQAVEKLNQFRSIGGNEDIAADEQLQTWVNENIDAFVEDKQVNVSEILNKLPLDLHTITSAAARTIEAKNAEELLSQLEYWAEGHSDETKVIATRLYQANKGKLGCLLVAAKKVPEFDLALLNQGVTEFYNTCRHCEEPHLGTLQEVNLALSVSCPHCKKTYDLLAADMLGRYHRANSFLEGMSPPPAATSDATNRFEEMMGIWSAVVERTRYTVDLAGSNGAKDTWQKPSETYTFQNGDCEDSSLMLVDWLISRGFEARVAVGHALGQGGHAWCVVRLEEKQYVLESTLKKAPQNPPEPELVSDQYEPHYLFDRHTLYFPKKKSLLVTDYFSASDWQGIDYDQESMDDHSIAGASSLEP